MGRDSETAVEILDLLKSGGMKVGPELEKAHGVARAREGDPAFDWIHALCHRIEGDEWNADYWYRRAGRSRFDGDIQAEWAHMKEALGRAQ